jgi:hypothetical protein
VTETPPSLDPLKSPWQRGDVCTRAFELAGFVVSRNQAYMQIRWNDGSTEQVPDADIDSLTRFAHANSLGPDGKRTNLEYLETLEALDYLEHAIAERMKTIKEHEKPELDRLVRRLFAENQCEWDKKHAAQLTAMLANPRNVGIIFRIRDRIHCRSCPVK